MNNLATDYPLGLNPCQYQPNQPIQPNQYPYSVPHIVIYNPSNNIYIPHFLPNQNIVGVIPNQNIYGEVSIQNVYGVASNPNVYGNHSNQNVYGSQSNPNVYGVAPNPNVYGVAPNPNPNPNVYGVEPNPNVYGAAPNPQVCGVVNNQHIYDLLSKHHNTNRGGSDNINRENDNINRGGSSDNTNLYRNNVNYVNNQNDNNQNDNKHKTIDTDDLRKLAEQYSSYSPNIFEEKNDNIYNRKGKIETIQVTEVSKPITEVKTTYSNNINRDNPINIENSVKETNLNNKENNVISLIEPINEEEVENKIMDVNQDPVNGQLITNNNIHSSSIPENLINTIRNTMPELINRVLNNRNENRGQIFIETYLQPNSTELLFNVYNRENADNEDTDTGLKLTDIRDNTEVLLFSNIDTDEEKCAICETTYMSDTIIRKINKCNHFCCMTCLDKWFEQNDNCPHCKQEIMDEMSAEIESETDSNIELINTDNPLDDEIGDSI